MRSVVGSAAETDDFDTPPPRRRSVKAPTSRGKPKITRPKRPEPESLLSRWIGSLRNSMRWGVFWGAVLLAFFFVVAVAGLFSSGKVASALADVRAEADKAMARAGLTVSSVKVEGRAGRDAADVQRMVGVKAGDLITHLNGNSVQGLTLQEAVEQMRGERGTAIKITIRREGADRPIELSLTREVIRPQVVRFRMEGNDIGYIRLTSFNEQTETGLKRALTTLRQQAGPGGLKGLVLDLRNNPGGLLDQAVQVSDDFLDQGEIVSTRARRPEDAQRWNAKAGDIAQGIPMVVLINGGSASASEIVAGALQDHRRAVVLGVKSFGKGSVQTVMPIPGQGAIRLTTARYYTPSGRSIQGTGIEPDIEVLAQRQEATAAIPREREADLRRALRNEGAVQQPANTPAIPPLNLPAGVVEKVSRLPAEGAPAFDPTKPETDFQLQQAIGLLRNMAGAQAAAPGRRAAAK
jgi:carboxyl-terminal processing protease